jgi:hypothetical protein
MYTIIPAAYIFTHVYLNTMQQGIQSLHVVGELFANHRTEPAMNDIIYDWATNHKVVHILNAGGGEDYDAAMVTAKILSNREKLPFSVFFEPDIFGSPMAFGMIVTPEVCYASEVAVDGLEQLKMAEEEHPHELTQFLSQFRSAR